MAECKYCIDEICVNADCPMRADYCPVPNDEGVCRYEERTPKERGDDKQKITCLNCKHLMFSDCYGECGMGYMGVVRPDDFCSRGERKEGYDNG